MTSNIIDKSLNAVSDAGSWSKRLIMSVTGTIWLIFLYGATLWLVVGALSGYQIRLSLEGLDANPTFNEVERAANRIESDIDRINGDVWAKEDEFYTHEQSAKDILERLKELEDGPSAILLTRVDRFGGSGQLKDLTEDCDKENVALGKELCTLIDEFNAAFLALQDSRAQHEEAQKIAAPKFDKIWRDLGERVQRRHGVSIA